MSAFLSVILIIFWLAVLGMVFGNFPVNEIAKYFFYIIAPIAIITGIVETIRPKKPYH